MSTDRNIRDVITDDGQRGIVLNMPREKYTAIQRMNCSRLVEGLLGPFEIDPVGVRDAFENTRAEPKSSQQDSYDRGTLAHLILLQPEQLVDRVAVWKGKTRHGSEWEAFENEHSGKLIMRPADVADVQRACREFRKTKQVNDLLRPCDTEVAVFSQEGGIFCKGSIDAVTRAGLCVILDPKTVGVGIDSETVRRQIRKFHYREKMAMYARWYTAATGREVDAVYLIFISLPPQRIGVRLVKLTTAALQWGEARMLAVLRAVKECIAKDDWPTFFADDFADVSPWELMPETPLQM